MNAEDLLRWTADVEERCNMALHETISMELGVSENEEDYSLQYIAEKLAQCSSFLEKLSNLQLSLTRMGLEVVKKTFAVKGLRRVQESTLKSSDEYVSTPRDQKSAWVTTQLSLILSVEESCTYATRMVSEVRDAVSDRMQLMKRLDSDIRLQQKILETKVVMGLASTNSASGSLAFRPKVEPVGEMDLS